MSHDFDDRSWDLLIGRIKEKRCTPILGAGASHPSLAFRGDLARRWAQTYGYPYADSDNLAAVAQYMAVDQDPLAPKRAVLELSGQAADRPDFTAPGQPHGVLARLPIALFLTTSYDNYMSEALKRENKAARQERYPWNEASNDRPSSFDEGGVATVANPVVYHLYGCGTPESVVITEDDRLEFLAKMAGGSLLPKSIGAALRANTCLFLGYDATDSDLKVLFQALRAHLTGVNIICLSSPPPPEQRVKLHRYYERKLSHIDARLYWGTASEFCAQLEERWEAAS